MRKATQLLIWLLAWPCPAFGLPTKSCRKVVLEKCLGGCCAAQPEQPCVPRACCRDVAEVCGDIMTCHRDVIIQFCKPPPAAVCTQVRTLWLTSGFWWLMHLAGAIHWHWGAEPMGLLCTLKLSPYFLEIRGKKRRLLTSTVLAQAAVLK